MDEVCQVEGQKERTQPGVSQGVNAIRPHTTTIAKPPARARPPIDRIRYLNRKERTDPRDDHGSTNRAALVERRVDSIARPARQGHPRRDGRQDHDTNSKYRYTVRPANANVKKISSHVSGRP